MTLPVTGPLSLGRIAAELSRASETQVSLAEATVRILAGVPRGAIRLSNLRGKSAVTARNAASLNLATAFGEDYARAVDKTLIVPSGVILGPLTIPSGMGGSLTIGNAGEIQGPGGAANGGAGGAAITSSHDFTLINTGAVRGGGGGGGKGGAGGQGRDTSRQREPASGDIYNYRNTYAERELSYASWDDDKEEPYIEGWRFYWNGFVGRSSRSTLTRGASTYYEGRYRTYYRRESEYYGIYRWSSVTRYFVGGCGGNGGCGRGYNQTRATGATGASGGTSAGTGGAGGDGGDWGRSGATGGPGGNGNDTNGAAGSAGGAPGRAVRMLAGRLILDNSGTINGAT